MALVCASLFALTKCQLSYTFPIRTVRVYGLNRVDKREVKDMLTPMVLGGFFAINVDALRDRLLQIAWVGDIYARRIWPDQVEVTIVEKQAIAKWNPIERDTLSDAALKSEGMKRESQSLLAADGEFFSPDIKTYPEHLPQFTGPAGKQILMLHYFNDINRLLTPLHAKISYLMLTPYLSLKVKLDNGVLLEMGHKDILTRLADLVRVYPKIVGQHVEKIEYIDLRYPNGVAVRWKKEYGKQANE